MKLIIDIDKDVYDDIEHNKGEYINTLNWAVRNGKPYEERPQGEWVRKEDIIRYIATQYSEHNELVPVWLNIGDLKGGAE